MKKLFLFTFFVILSLPKGFSQNKTLDSLFTVLKTAKEDTNKVNTLIAIGDELKLISEYDKATENSNKALKLAQVLNFKSGIAYAHNNLGNIFQNTGDYVTALYHYNSAQKIYEVTNDKKGVAAVLNNIAIVYYSQGDYSNALKGFSSALKINIELDNKKYTANNYSNIGSIYSIFGNFPEALKNYLASLKLREEIGDTRGIASNYNNIGGVYNNTRDYSLALKNYMEALKIVMTLGDKNGIAKSYNNIANIYAQMKNYQEAFKNYFASLKLKEEIGDKHGMASVNNNIGLVYDEQGSYSQALKYYLEAIKISEEFKSNLNLSIFYNNLSTIYIRQKQFLLAKQYLEKALSISKTGGDKNEMKLIYKSIAVLDSALGNFKKYSEDLKMYMLYKDSLINEESSKKIAEAQMQFDFGKKESETKIEQAKKDAKATEEKRNKEFILIGLVVLLFIIVGVSILLFRQNKLKSEQKSIQLEQKLLRSQMNPHFIFNALQAIENFITDEKAEKYLTSFASLSRSVLENSRLESISLNKEIALLHNYLDLQKLLHGNQFNYSINVAPHLDVENILIPPMISQPFIENAIEHGMRDIESGGLIEISFSADTKNLFLQIKDNGTGLNSNSKNEHHSLATTITAERMALFNKKKQKASFVITEADPGSTRPGLKVNFTFPIAYS